MLINKYVEILLNGFNVEYYENLGYKIPRRKDKWGAMKMKQGTKIKVKIEDLQKGSNQLVDILCDYCNKNIFKRPYYDYLKSKEKTIGKDCCKKCKTIKRKEVLQKLYNVENQFQRETVKEKCIETNFKKYGTKYVNQSNLVKEKIKNTNIKKYGCPSPMQSDIVKFKVRRSLYKNGTAPCSKQQEYMHNIIGGELNYPYYNANLDIAFPNKKTYIECDFGGHWLAIKLGNETKEEFEKRQRNRWYSLYRNGWKEIRIISKKDKLPTNTKVIEMIKYANEYLDLGHSWIKFDLDNKTVKNSLGEITYDYGKLKRM